MCMKKNIFYLLSLACCSCNASSHQQPISPLAQYTYLRQRTPKTTSSDKENTEQKNTVTGSPSKEKGQKPEVRKFLAKQAIKKGLFPTDIIPQ